MLLFLSVSFGISSIPQSITTYDTSMNDPQVQPPTISAVAVAINNTPFTTISLSPHINNNASYNAGYYYRLSSFQSQSCFLYRRRKSVAIWNPRVQHVNRLKYPASTLSDGHRESLTRTARRKTGRILRSTWEGLVEMASPLILNAPH